MQENKKNKYYKGWNGKGETNLSTQKKKSVDKLLEQKGENLLGNRVQESSVINHKEFINSIFFYCDRITTT